MPIPPGPVRRLSQGSARRAGIVAVVGAFSLLAGCGDSSSGDEESSCSASSSTCCEPENLVWLYDRVTDPDSHSYPKTIFRFHRGAETALTEDDAGDAPSVSPDGSQIVFQRGSDGDPESSGSLRSRLYVMNRYGADEQLLLGDADQPESTDPAAPAWDTHPVWSPDGSRVAFLRNTGFTPPGDVPGDVHRVMVVSADGGEPRPLPGSVSDLHDPAPAWSADGTRLAWITGGFSTPTLYWASLDGEDIREVRLAGEPVGPPAWIEADRAIAVTVGDRLHRIDAESGAQTELDVPVALRAIWTLPTGELAGLDGTEERSRLVVMDVEEPHDVQEITTIDGSRILPTGSVGARTRGPVTAVPALPDGWTSCPSSQPSG